jgi:hypothetical protein
MNLYNINYESTINSVHLIKIPEIKSTPAILELILQKIKLQNHYSHTKVKRICPKQAGTYKN